VPGNALHNALSADGRDQFIHRQYRAVGQIVLGPRHSGLRWSN